MDEARIVETEAGKVVEGEGWFVLNAREVTYEAMPGRGAWSLFESGGSFEHYGFGIHVLMPGETPGYYHAESAQEDFLVLSGECIAVVEGEERRLRPWDLPALPARDQPHHDRRGRWAVRDPHGRRALSGRRVHYPVDEVAARHGASVAEPADESRDAYAGEDRTRSRVRAPWPPA